MLLKRILGAILGNVYLPKERSTSKPVGGGVQVGSISTLLRENGTGTSFTDWELPKLLISASNRIYSLLQVQLRRGTLDGCKTRWEEGEITNITGSAGDADGYS